MLKNNGIIRIIIFIENRRRTRGGGEMKYENPSMEILLFYAQDIVRTSPLNDNDEGDEPDGDEF